MNHTPISQFEQVFIHLPAPMFSFCKAEVSSNNGHPSVKEQICEQASYTLHHINRAKLFTENSAMARLRDILRGWGSAVPLQHTMTHGLLRESRRLVSQTTSVIRTIASWLKITQISGDLDYNHKFTNSPDVLQAHCFVLFCPSLLDQQINSSYTCMYM